MEKVWRGKTCEKFLKYEKKFITVKIYVHLPDGNVFNFARK